MKVMVLVKATERSEAGEMPNEELLTQMTDFNEELVNAGVMLAGEGLHPSSKGFRVAFRGGEQEVTPGPFGETRELVAGFWLWQVESMDEAMDWVKRMPSPAEGDEGEVEVRPVFEADDFGENFTPELREREDRMREQVEQSQ